MAPLHPSGLEFDGNWCRSLQFCIAADHKRVDNLRFSTLWIFTLLLR